MRRTQSRLRAKRIAAADVGRTRGACDRKQETGQRCYSTSSRKYATVALRRQRRPRTLVRCLVVEQKRGGAHATHSSTARDHAARQRGQPAAVRMQQRKL